MADDKSPLTRRRVLGGMATIGAAGAVGAGTWSRFTDEENKQVTVSAGTLDLQVEHNGQWYNGDTVKVEGGPLKNGGKFKDCETLKNTGNVTGNNLRIRLPEDGLVDYENGLEEPEEGIDTTGGDPGAGRGELSQYLSIKGSLSCTSDPCTPSSDGAKVGYVPLEDALGHDIEVPVNMGENDTCELCFTVKLSEEGENANANDAMGDSTQFDIDLTLEQNPSSGS
ncbi:SipW-dependent-type signal peptide-containing protein [Halococcus sp. AFM35]|uniref:SipW-dependent-type signal peptide-containing protein n=1 Tax=Halococcus sp. AFM35 TaxID=3421653 RepID=UPI003EBBFC0F